MQAIGIICGAYRFYVLRLRIRRPLSKVRQLRGRAKLLMRSTLVRQNGALPRAGNEATGDLARPNRAEVAKLALESQKPLYMRRSVHRLCANAVCTVALKLCSVGRR